MPCGHAQLLHWPTATTKGAVVPLRYNKTVNGLATMRSKAFMADARRRQLDETTAATAAATGRKPMRIHVHYDWEWCGALETLIEEQLMAPALKLFQESLHVTPVEGNFLLNEQKDCAPMVTPTRIRQTAQDCQIRTTRHRPCRPNIQLHLWEHERVC